MQYRKKNEQMPLKEILKILRWHLELKIMDYQWVCEDIEQGVLDPMAGLSASDGLKEGYCVYHAMRQFLSYHAVTKLERRALELLGRNTMEQERERDASGGICL